MRVGENKSKNGPFGSGERDLQPRYKNYRILNEKELVRNYYINCAFMFYPWEWNKKRLTKEEKRRLTRLSKKSVRYARLGLKYYPDSERGKDIISRNLKFLDAFGNSS